MIEIRQLYKTYQTSADALPVLRDVNLSIAGGEFVAIMGPSGSGKTTLMNVIGCLDRFDKGSYRLANQEISKLSDTALARLRLNRIGFVFQSFNLVNHMSALRNVELPLIYAGASRRKRRHIARRLLEQVGLKERIHHLPNQLSGGQQQRVAIARALVNRPRVIVADEPTGSLDSQTGIAIMNLLRAVHSNGTTVLLVTHEQSVANYAHRIVRVADGRIVASEKTTQSLTSGHAAS